MSMLSGLINIEEKTTLLSIDQIKIDGGTQMRAGLHEQTVVEYMEAMAPVGWSKFPPVIVYHDGESYWLADGFHRVEAFCRVTAELGLQDTKIPADVRAGTRRDAILYAAGANATHGLRRTNADKRRAVETLLRDEEWRQWSDREIARRCQVSHNFVSEIRRRSLSSDDSEHSKRRYITKHGTTAIMNTAGIGASTANDIKALNNLADEMEQRARGDGSKADDAAQPDIAERLLRCMRNSATLQPQQQQIVLKEMMLGHFERYRQMLEPFIDFSGIEDSELRDASRRAYLRLLEMQMKDGVKDDQEAQATQANGKDDRYKRLAHYLVQFEECLAALSDWATITGQFTATLEADRGLRKLIGATRSELAMFNEQLFTES